VDTLADVLVLGNIRSLSELGVWPVFYFGSLRCLSRSWERLWDSVVIIWCVFLLDELRIWPVGNLSGLWSN